MYLAKDIIDLSSLSKRLLSDPEKITIKELDELKTVLRFHEYRYYIELDPLISDSEYDRLFSKLEELEKAHPSLITPDSPTQRVATVLTKDFQTLPHLVPMLSLENSYDATDLRAWDKKARDISGLPSIEYCVEPKYDGASISLTYENDQLLRGVTRGDGVEGDDITTNIRQIRTVPLSAKFSSYGLHTIEIRGEVMMSKKSFKQYNDRLAKLGIPPLANPRNAAAGSLRIKDPAEAKRRNLEVFLYHVSYYGLLNKTGTPVELNSHGGSLELLYKLGFRTPAKEKQVLNGIDEVIRYCEAFEAGRDDLPYEIDGMVVKVNDVELQDRLGMTTHHPRWAIAYKFKARQASSKLNTVEYQVGRTGSITPVAKIDPVPLGGVTVSSVSLFNEDVIKEKNLMIGDSVLVERAGDVIPYIVKSFSELRTGKEKPIVFPTHCPVCGDILSRLPEEAAWRCNNINCEAQVLERMIHFTSKDAMDIRGFGDALIKRFFAEGYLKDIPGIYHLPFDVIGQQERFGEKSISNLKNAIEKSKSQPLHRLIYSLGIRFVGETTAKTLAHEVNHILDFRSMSVETLQNLEDIGPKVAGSIYQFFQNPDSICMIEQLEQSGVNVVSNRKQGTTAAGLTGISFLFTGSLPTLKRSEAEEMVEALGGQVLSGVSSKLHYLVAGEDAGSKLEKAKKISSIKIINEEEFVRLLSK